MLSSTLWFSYRQERYDPNNLGGPDFWTGGKPEPWNWDNCRFNVIPIGESRVRLVIRRKKEFVSRKRKRLVCIDLMISIVVLEFKKTEINDQIKEGNKVPTNLNHKRKVIKLEIKNDLRGDDRPLLNCQIWQLTEQDDGSLDNLYKELLYAKNQPPKPDHDVIFDTDVPLKEGIVPVIYQPRVDALKNILDEVHVKRNQDNFEVMVVFEDEHLNKHWYFDIFYRIARYFIYKRVQDVESFDIKSTDNTATHFNFEGIYSDKYVLYHDNIHGDPVPAPDREVKHWHVSKNHPIVFVNTSNHAMAEFDTNHSHWKWEYVPWQKDRPTILSSST